jgi:soluble lytic murein transglycosylase-like protein
MPPSTLIALAHTAAAAHALDPALVCAICEQESAWDPFALRYEPAFFDRYVAPQLAAGKISVTEAHARAFSWGLMQVMGQVAREACARMECAPPDGARLCRGKQNPAAPQAPDDVQPPGEGNSPLPPALTSSTPLSRLCDPATGLDIGCRIFAAKLSAAHNDVTRALLLWNGGANAAYPAEVLARLPHF